MSNVIEGGKLFMLFAFYACPFAVGVYLYKKTKSGIVSRICFGMLVLCALLFYLFYVIAYYFTADGINEAVMYHLEYGLAGAGLGEYGKLIAVSVSYIIGSLVFVGWIWRGGRKNTAHKPIYGYAAFLCLVLSLCFNPATSDLYRYYGATSVSADANFDDYYRQPEIKPAGSGKNLVYIYAEGLESTYFDESIFPGLIKGLRALRDKSVYFSDIKGVTGAGCTIAGMVASQCGIPLFTAVQSPNVPSSWMSDYLPNARCLGDLLHGEGYYLAYYGGVDLSFAGKGDFYSTHRFDEVLGRRELLPELADSSYNHGWGLYDDSLLDLDYRRFLELSSTREKFAFFTLTLDTHHPNGYISRSCPDKTYGDGRNKMLNAVACSDYLISSFANKILASPYASNTVIVIASDHLGMKNTATGLLERGDRKNFFIIIDPDGKSGEITKIGSALDIGPTLLPFLGYEGEIGLGRDLVNGTSTAAETEAIHRNLRFWRSDVALFWDYPRIEKEVSISPLSQTIAIDKKIYTLPALIRLDNLMQTDIILGHKHISRVIASNPDDSPYLLVDKTKKDSKDLYYMVAGRGSEQYARVTLDKDIKLPKDKVRQLVGLDPVSGAGVRAALMSAGVADDLLIPDSSFRVERVAHAGGGIGGKTYTDSIDALDYNIKRGFAYFELDFSFTRDGQLVCIHDWKDNFKDIFGFELPDRPTLEDFSALVDNYPGPKNCTLDTLAGWMEQNPSAVIVTDVKDDNFSALRIIAEKISDFQERIIPQVYDPANFEKIKGLGYEQMIWTLYRYGGSDASVLDWVDKLTPLGPLAITMPTRRARTTLPAELAGKGIPTYVHTINDKKRKNEFLGKYGVTEVYTDFLPPEDRRTVSGTNTNIIFILISSSMNILLSVFVFFFGLTIGSFINCLVWRLHKKEGMWDRSYCPKCRKQIAWYDNIPLLSFCLLRGKCRHCRKSISLQYPLVELAVAVLFLLAWRAELALWPIASGLDVDLSMIIPSIHVLAYVFRDWFIIAVMTVIFIYDLRWYLILDKITLPACAVIVAINLLLGANWLNMLISGIIGGGFFYLQFIISRGKWIGGGDIRLGLLMGLSLGWPYVLLAIFLAYFLGSIVGVGLILSGKKKWGSRIPLGTFLSFSTVIILLWGRAILAWYLHFIFLI